MGRRASWQMFHHETVINYEWDQIDHNTGCLKKNDKIFVIKTKTFLFNHYEKLSLLFEEHSIAVVIIAK